MQDKISELALEIIEDADDVLETKELEQKIAISIKNITRTKLFSRLTNLRGSGLIRGKFVGPGKGVWIWWKKDAFSEKQTTIYEFNGGSKIKESMKNNTVLFVLPSKEYKNIFSKIIKLTLAKKRKPCIVLVNQNYVSLSAELKKKGINPDNLFFIDCVSKEKEKDEKKKNVVYITSPQALTELIIAIKKMLKGNCGGVIIDSLSTLLVYNNSSQIFKFTQNLVTSANINNKSLFLTLLEGDYRKPIVGQIQMLTDKVTVLGKTLPAKEDAVRLMKKLFGSEASKIVEKTAKGKKPELLLKEFQNILSELVGPANAEKQVEELSQKYV